MQMYTFQPSFRSQNHVTYMVGNTLALHSQIQAHESFPVHESVLFYMLEARFHNFIQSFIHPAHTRTAKHTENEETSINNNSSIIIYCYWPHFLEDETVYVSRCVYVSYSFIRYFRYTLYESVFMRL